MISPLYTILQAQRTLNIKVDYHDYSDEPNHLSLSVFSLPLFSPPICFLSLTVHTEASSEGKPVGRRPGGDSTYENPSKPPSVKVIGGSASANWARPCSLALLFAALCLQWTLFWCPLWIPHYPPLGTTHMHRDTHIIYISCIASLLPVLNVLGSGGDDGNGSTGCGREEDNVVGDYRQWGLLQELVCPAASPMWVFAQANLMHAHLQKICFF